MARYICRACGSVYEQVQTECPQCGTTSSQTSEFATSDDFLKREVPHVLYERQKSGLEGLVGGLDALIINTEADRQKSAAEELLRYTGYRCNAVFENDEAKTCVLSLTGSADLLIRSRKQKDNPFLAFNKCPGSMHVPNTRLETLVFRVTDLDRYVEIQAARGVRFLTHDIIEHESYRFIQTMPSLYTGNSIGLIEWRTTRHNWQSKDDQPVAWELKKSRKSHLAGIGFLDHAATRVRAKERDAAIIEFLGLTNYRFAFAIYVKSQNSITSVTRRSDGDFALVFTSGIAPYISDEESGPTEKFVHNYGTRVHHLAFTTAAIEATFEALRADDLDFLLELVGSETEGLRQTFSVPSPNTLLVTEYIHRYGDFDGFFTRSNVTLLTEATGAQ